MTNKKNKIVTMPSAHYSVMWVMATHKSLCKGGRRNGGERSQDQPCGCSKHDQGKEVSGQWCAGEWLTGSFGEGSNL